MLFKGSIRSSTSMQLRLYALTDLHADFEMEVPCTVVKRCRCKCTINVLQFCFTVSVGTVEVQTISKTSLIYFVINIRQIVFTLNVFGQVQLPTEPTRTDS